MTKTDKNGEIRTGTIWSPHPSIKPMLSRLVTICDNLCSLGVENDILLTNILKGIEVLTEDLKNTDKIITLISQIFTTFVTENR